MFSKSFKDSFYLFIYGFVLVLEMYAVATQNKSLEFIVKPFLTIVLMVMYLKLSNRKNYYYIAVLVLSLFVDMTLINRTDNTYLVLALSFLTLIYILHIKILRKDHKRMNVYRFIVAFIPYLFCLGLFFFLAKDYLGNFFLLALMHTFLLFFVVNIAFLNYLRSNRKGDLYLFLGLFTFILADTTFAFYRWFFVSQIFYLVIATFLFALAQGLICKAIIVKSKKNVK